MLVYNYVNANTRSVRLCRKLQTTSCGPFKIAEATKHINKGHKDRTSVFQVQFIKSYYTNIRGKELSKSEALVSSFAEDELVLDRGMWCLISASDNTVILKGLIKCHNHNKRKDLMLVELEATATLFSKDMDVATLFSTRAEIRALHQLARSSGGYPCPLSSPDARVPRADGHWTPYSVRRGTWTAFEVTLTIRALQPAAGDDTENAAVATADSSAPPRHPPALQCAVIDLNFVSYGFNGHRRRRHQVVLPLAAPPPISGEFCRILQTSGELTGETANVLPISTHILCNLDDPAEVVRRYVAPVAQSLGRGATGGKDEPGAQDGYISSERLPSPSPSPSLSRQDGAQKRTAQEGKRKFGREEERRDDTRSRLVVLVVAESALAVVQGRWRHYSAVTPGWLARLACLPFHPTANLSSSCAMQCLMDEIGALRTFVAIVAGVVARLILGRRGRGVFYRVAGQQSTLVDDVTGTLPPYDTSIVLGPVRMKEAAEAMKAALIAAAAAANADGGGGINLKGLELEVAVADVNDLAKEAKAAAAAPVTEGTDGEQGGCPLVENRYMVKREETDRERKGGKLKWGGGPEKIPAPGSGQVNGEGVEILSYTGRTTDMARLRKALSGNPAGNQDQQTPMVLIEWTRISDM